MKKCLATILIVISVFSAVAQGTTQSVFPAGFENQAGSAAYDLFTTVPEYQQMFRGSVLATTWKTPVEITGVAFRVTDGGASFNTSVSSIEIRLSTSANTPDSMSSSYSVNRGPDETTVFSHQNVGLSGNGGPNVNPFDIKFQFDRPFIYNPTSGSLLLYVTHTGGAFTSSVDAEFPGGTPVPIAGFGKGLLFPQPFAVITEFTSFSVPEPDRFALLAFGLGIFCFLKHTKGRRTWL